MAYLLTEHFTDEPIAVTLSLGAQPGDEKVRIKFGATVIRTNVAEAVDLVDAVAEALSQIPENRELRRDEDTVRSDAEIRESL